jgi:hypothetical protein
MTRARQHVAEKYEEALLTGCEYFSLDLTSYGVFVKEAILRELFLNFDYIGYRSSKSGTNNAIYKLTDIGRPGIELLYIVAIAEPYGLTMVD